MGWQGIPNLFNHSSATLPMAMTVLSGKRRVNCSKISAFLTISFVLGLLLLKIPFVGSNGCHGKAFHKANRTGGKGEFKMVSQTIVAVGSEKP